MKKKHHFLLKFSTKINAQGGLQPLNIERETERLHLCLVILNKCRKNFFERSAYSEASTIRVCGIKYFCRLNSDSLAKYSIFQGRISSVPIFFSLWHISCFLKICSWVFFNFRIFFSKILFLKNISFSIERIQLIYTVWRVQSMRSENSCVASAPRLPSQPNPPGPRSWIPQECFHRLKYTVWFILFYYS